MVPLLGDVFYDIREAWAPCSVVFYQTQRYGQKAIIEPGFEALRGFLHQASATGLLPRRIPMEAGTGVQPATDAVRPEQPEELASRLVGGQMGQAVVLECHRTHHDGSGIVQRLQFDLALLEPGGRSFARRDVTQQDKQVPIARGED